MHALVFNRTDVFKCLFGGKGKDCPHKLGCFYDEKDFDVALLVGLYVTLG